MVNVGFGLDVILCDVVEKGDDNEDK